jgi:hypothetical protein
MVKALTQSGMYFNFRGMFPSLLYAERETERERGRERERERERVLVLYSTAILSSMIICGSETRDVALHSLRIGARPWVLVLYSMSHTG